MIAGSLGEDKSVIVQPVREEAAEFYVSVFPNSRIVDRALQRCRAASRGQRC